MKNIKPLLIVFACIAVFSLIYTFTSLFQSNSPISDLTDKLEKVEAVTQEERKKFYDVVNQAKLDAFIQAKIEQKTIEEQIKHYIDKKEELIITTEVQERIKNETTKEVTKVFIQKVLENNGIDNEAFEKEFRNLLKLSEIETLEEITKAKAYELVKIMKDRYSMDLFVFDGSRSAEEQSRLKNNTKSTKADAWQSSHQYGYAFDVVCKVDGQLTWSNCNYAQIGIEGKRLGLDWGGDWDSFVDKPHFELPYKLWNEKAKIKKFVCLRESPLCSESDLFYEVGKEKGVDPYLLVAIAVADTSLGKSLKTEYNIGNWGNVDHGTDGKTCIGRTTGGCGVHLTSWKEGIEKMATATSIRKNEKIGNLSPYCGIGGIYYATSTSNWHKNVSSILTELHGEDKDWCNYNYKK